MIDGETVSILTTLFVCRRGPELGAVSVVIAKEENMSRGLSVSIVPRSAAVMLWVGILGGCEQPPREAAEPLDDVGSNQSGLHESSAGGPGDAESLADDDCGGGTPTAVTVDARAALAKFSSIAVGLNAAAWDGSLVHPEIPKLVRSAGVQTLRYPGGSTSDNYHWLSNSADDPNQGGTHPDSNFDAYMSVVKAARAESMITVNYGSGTEQEAADWVRYANRGGPRYRGPVPTYPGASRKGHDYGIRYWEIGNELYGDGTYGAQWEVNRKPHDPTTYAQGVVSYSAAMKAVDPSIRIGVVLTAPGNWPDDQISGASPQPWNDTVLAIACDAVDFAVLHWYPQGPTGESDAALLAAPEKGESTGVSYTPAISDMVGTLKAKLTQYCGPHASAVSIMVTETNSVSYNPGKQTTSVVNALFLADQLTTWFENGVTNVDWWALHNSPFDGNADPSLYGEYSFGDYGVLSAGFTSAGGAVEPPVDTPFPGYYALEMLSYLGHGAEDTLIKTTSSSDLVGVHAVKQRNGRINVLLINKDPSASHEVALSLSGASSRGWASVHRYGATDASITARRKAVRGPSFRVTLQPYSLVAVQLP